MYTSEDRQSQRLEDIKLILKDLLKVIKVVSMYPVNNPLPQSLKRTFTEKLVYIVETHGALEITVDRNSLFLGDEIVFTDRSKEESLAGMFFETGIIRFSFKEGLDVDDVYKLLEVIKDYQNSYNKSVDLANHIWEAGISRFSFETIEDIALAEYDGDFRTQEFFQAGRNIEGGGQISTDRAEGYNALFAHGQQVEVAPDEDGGTFVSGQPGVSGAAPPAYVVEGESIIGTVLGTGDGQTDQNLNVAQAVEALGLSDLTGKAPGIPDTTIILNDKFKLSEEEEEQIARIVSRDAEFSVYESVSELLKELLHQEAEMNQFYETVTICEKIITEFVQAGKLTYASEVLRYLRTLEEQIRSEKPLWAERLKDALVTAGSRNRLAVLTQALNQHEELGSMELRGYMDNFGWEALMGITDMLGEIQHAVHRETVKDYLALRGKDNMDIVAKGIYGNNPEIVSASVAVLARIGDTQALSHLKKLIGHKDQQVRLNLVTSLQECPNDDALQLLRELVADEDVSIRTKAVKSIVARRGQPAFNVISEIIGDDQFTYLDRSDQQAILNAFSVLGGDMAVAYLAGLIEKANPFKNADLAFYRETAFEALSLNRSDKAERALLKLAASWRRDIKTRAVSSLKKRRELIFGESDEQSEQ